MGANFVGLLILSLQVIWPSLQILFEPLSLVVAVSFWATVIFSEHYTNKRSDKN